MAMKTLSQLLDPKVFASLTPEDIDMLETVIHGEVAANPEIQKQLKAKIDKFVPHLKGPGGHKP